MTKMILLLVCRRLIWGGLLFAIYGLCSTWPRLPLEMSITNRLASLVWAAGLFAGAGAAVGGMISMLAFIAGRTAPPRYRPTMSAIVETTILLFLVIWITLNEFVYLTTSEVLGLNTLLLLWHNTAAVLENAWKMGGRYLLATAGIALAIGTALFILTRRSYRSIQLPGNRPTGASATIIPGLTAGIMIVFLTVATLIGRQFHTAPSQSLVELSRSAPLLRVFNLTRALMKIDLTGSPPDHFGPPIISQEQYQTTMGTPRHPAPNIIYILMESTSAGALHCYGHPKTDITPHIDALAAEGALFEHCLAAASFSSCGLTSIITSLYLLRGERFDYFSDPFPFMGLPRALKLAGYQLTLFSSGNESFDRINHFYPPSDFDVYFSHDTCKINKSDCMRMDDKYAIGEFEKWLSGRRDARPFYTGFYLQSPHFNYEVPEPWYSHDQPIPPLYSNGDGILHIPADVLPKLRNQYDNSIRYADHWVGRIRAALEQNGDLDRSIIIITGDHGEAFMQHGLARHGVHTWEEMIHIPLIIYPGRLARNAFPRAVPCRIQGTVSGIDIAPTIASMIGIAPHPSWQGINVLDPQYTARNRPVFSMTQYTRWQEAVCLNQYKYIFDLTDVREHLFDLDQDPGEQIDLAKQYPQLAAAMRELLSGWHTYQLAYYSPAKRPFTHYVGRYEPNPVLLNRILELAAIRPPPEDRGLAP